MPIMATSSSIEAADSSTPGSAILTNCTLSGNTAIDQGCGIYNRGPLTLSNTTVSNNAADAAGGIFNTLGSATLNNSTVSGNSAFRERYCRMLWTGVN